MCMLYLYYRLNRRTKRSASAGFQDTAEAASVQRAAVTVAGMLRGQQQAEAAEELLQHYAVEDLA